MAEHLATSGFFDILPLMKRSRGFVLAIDGPAGSGKSTTAKLCAERLGYCHLDTGAMYRAVTLKALRTRTDMGDQEAAARLLKATTVGVRWCRGEMRVVLDGRDVSDDVRSPDVSAFVSEVSAIPEVRRKMVAEQRRVAHERNVVCEGRDIGSVVFPDADLKIYLECRTDERARRRRLELAGKGTRVSHDSVQQNLTKRDRIDSHRRTSPLLRMPDAILVDTSDLTIEEQVAVVCDLARRRMRS
jgi:cytidylate kinase